MAYRNENQNLGWASKDEVFIRRPFPTNIPAAIRDLKPKDIRVKTNFVMLNFSRLPRLCVVAFQKGTKQYGTFNYIDGLWFWDGNKNTPEMQRINGTNF